MTNRNKVLLVDGMALLFKGFFATAFSGNYMINSKGVPRNGIFGFLNYFTNAIETFQPTHVICCWDMGSKTFRTEWFPEYKANRDQPPVELIPQFDLIKEVTTAFNVPNIGLKGYEADDCIGTLAQLYKQYEEVIVVTGDKDMLQLVDDHVSVAIMVKGVGNYNVYDSHNFSEQMGISPAQVVDIKALMGDSADNYPGVKGIGEKTALKLIKEYDTVENLLVHLDSLPKGVRNKIEVSLDSLHLSKRLAKIFCEVPISCSLEEGQWSMDDQIVTSFLQDLEFKNTNRWMKALENISIAK
ncbi:5'-3' exonuclease H3TH domain-containing protein [Radiobacillus sp. PE A8.2]|uniref:5'-3' exonuclease n=1 Tax=Radiobacillus sp. PE A8.2 TaxID=3380349 RepID=UPI00388E4451